MQWGAHQSRCLCWSRGVRRLHRSRRLVGTARPPAPCSGEEKGCSEGAAPPGVNLAGSLRDCQGGISQSCQAAREPSRPAWTPVPARLQCGDGCRVLLSHPLSQHSAAARAAPHPAAPPPLCRPPLHLHAGSGCRPGGTRRLSLPFHPPSWFLGGKAGLAAVRRVGEEPGIPGGRWGAGQSVRLTRAGPALRGPRGGREAAHDHVLCILCCGGSAQSQPRSRPLPRCTLGANQSRGATPYPPQPTDPHSHEGLCSRERRSATDFFLARAAALRLSRSRMSRKDRRSDSSLSRSAGDRDVPSHPAGGGGWRGLSDAMQTEEGVTCPVPPPPAPAPAPHNPAIDGPRGAGGG